MMEILLSVRFLRIFSKIFSVSCSISLDSKIRVGVTRSNSIFRVYFQYLEVFMKSYRKWLGVFGMVLALGLVLIGCGDKDSGDPTSPGGGGGVLTVDNCPSGGSLVICDSAVPTTQMQLAGLISCFIAVGQAESATSYRLTKNNGTAFDNTGDFLVILTLGMDSYFKKVSFSNGSGSVDFNSMTSQTSLPVM